MKNIQVVDEIVQRTEELMKKFYGDDETSYIFTADHGMSAIGNHGDGSSSSPFIIHVHILTTNEWQIQNAPALP